MTRRTVSVFAVWVLVLAGVWLGSQAVVHVQQPPSGAVASRLPTERRGRVPFTVNATEWAATPALGLMVVTQDNRNGMAEANLVRVNVR